ncbi:SOS response-associated peptidase family protein [Janthinobacterium sp. SUN100]|uniref:SOS response-associated peptidase family protein n=1 Tax=Janthinobacterium sp. SUN100 TaxID=3004101 RepID=UPI0025B00042|nr:SOS response-associated peptidase family protein [Janthinobacterium sp. SUN100]MDN2701194.1 SOS response-associated peptidase family protein [Janthinobacterium sp. SUN100]
MAPILRGSHEAPGELEIAPAMFGMVPHWADHKLARQTYNARTEAVARKPSFRSAWKRKQFCIIPAANFFEPNYEMASLCAGASSARTAARWPLPGYGSTARGSVAVVLDADDQRRRASADAALPPAR